MFGGVTFVIVLSVPVAEARRNETVVEFIDVSGGGDGGPLGGAERRARRHGLAFHRIEVVVVIEEVSSRHHPDAGCRQVDGGGHRDSRQHCRLTAAFA